MRGIGTIKKFFVTMTMVLAMSFAVLASPMAKVGAKNCAAGSETVQVENIEVEKPWYESAWGGICDAASTCGNTVVEGACVVRNGVRHVAGSYLLWYAETTMDIATWAQETGSELVK